MARSARRPARYAAIHGRHATFDPRYLRALSDGAALARLLANLVAIYRAGGDGRGLVRVLLLRAEIPGVGERGRPELAAALTAVGRHHEAAQVWDAEAGGTGEVDAAVARAEAVRARANLN